MDNLQQLLDEWQTLQPLKPEDEKRLDRKFRLEFNYNSNHLEGNTLTYGQTKLLFMFGETSGSASLKDYEEMKAHNVGLEMMKQEAMDKERPLTEQFIRELNKTILVQDYWKDAKTPTGTKTRMEIKVGVYKSRPNSVITATGEEFHYALPEETPAFMTDLVDWYNAEAAKGVLSPVELAALLHYRYIRIHPFEDGNGRIARLLVNYILFRNGYPMIVIHTEDKQNYLRVLHQCDVAVGLTPSDGANASLDKIRPFVGYLNDCAERALRIGIKAAKGGNIEEEDDFEKELAVLQRQIRKEEVKTDSPKFSGEMVLDVLEKVYKPFVKKLEEAVAPSEVFFMSVRKYDWISKGLDLITGGMMKTSSVSKETLDDPETQEILENARAFVFRIDLSEPKREYNMKSIAVRIDGRIFLEETYYTFASDPDKFYPYATYPSSEDIARMIQSIKANILLSIRKAAKTE
ncbi:Fic family protein [uncultured Parabacteroides sp.]|uniref:Fic family protein n=1 Tax=uncultured Parabacteroides sp. TaxID=512312 RepID=UPI002804571F|nr:Fic family protein [uncultured Parabacteroides sp.]